MKTKLNVNLKRKVAIDTIVKLRERSTTTSYLFHPPNTGFMQINVFKLVPRSRAAAKIHTRYCVDV